jgi:hypothetical protein
MKAHPNKGQLCLRKVEGIYALLTVVSIGTLKLSH